MGRSEREVLRVAGTAGRGLLGSDSPLAAELAASAVLGYAWAVAPDDADEVGDLLATLARRARPAGDVGVYAVLRALARILPPERAAVAAEATAGWSPRQRPELPWDDAPAPRPLRAWLGDNPYGDETTLLIEYGEPARHALEVVVARAGAEQIVNVGLLPDAEDGVATSVYPLSPADVATVEAALAEAVWLSDELWPRPEADDPYVTFRALLAGRLRLWERVREYPDFAPMPDEDRQRLVDAFAAGSHDCEDEDVVRGLAHMFLDYGEGYITRPSPLHWSPAHVEVFLLDWLPRRTMLDVAERAALPDTLIDWCSFALEQAGLDHRLEQPIVDVIIDLEGEFHALYEDPRTWGPAKELAMTMVADGVDLEDRDAVARWIEADNARRAAQAAPDPRDD